MTQFVQQELFTPSYPQGKKRPRHSGDPLDLATLPTVPKPDLLVKLRDTALGLRCEDRKLLNLLLAVAWADPEHPDAAHTVSAAEVRRAIGRGTATDNRRLRESLDRLCTVKVPEFRVGPGSRRGPATVLARADFPEGGRNLTFAFTPRVASAIADPGVWGRVRRDIAAELSSTAGLMLYEQLCLRANLREPVWNVKTAESGALLRSIENPMTWKEMKRYVIDPTTELMARFGMNVVCQPLQIRSQRAFGRIRFIIGRPAQTQGQAADTPQTARVHAFPRLRSAA